MALSFQQQQYLLASKRGYGGIYDVIPASAYALTIANDETDEQKVARKLKEAANKIYLEWTTMPPSILPADWKPLSRWEMFKLNVGLWLINFSESSTFKGTADGKE